MRSDDDTEKTYPSSTIDDELLVSTGEPPSDQYSVVYLAMILMGTGLLFPYNTLITAVDYFDKAYPDFDLEFYIPLINMLSSPVIQVLMVMHGHRLSFTSRIITCFVFQAALVIGLPLMINNTSSHTSLWITLCLILLFGVSTAVLQSSVFGFAALLPSKYTTAIMSGNGVAGVVVSFTRIFTKLGFGDSDQGIRDGVLVYFGLSAFTCFLCAVVFVLIMKLPFTVFYVKPAVTQTTEADGGYFVLEEGGQSGKVSHLTSNAPEGVMMNQPIMDEAPPVTAKVVLRKIFRQLITVWGVFVTTFIVFPGLVVTIDSSYGLSGGWFAIILITEFNIFDLVGRYLPRFTLMFSPSNLWIPTFSRLVFFVLFLLCIHPHVFVSDVWPYVFMAFFAITNGYFASLAMMYGPSNVDSHERDVSGQIMSMGLNIGILTGSALAIAFKHMGVGSK